MDAGARVKTRYRASFSGLSLCTMESLEELVTSGRIVDLMLLFVVIEIVAILLIHRMTGAGIAAIPLLTNIGAGGSLMLALRADLTGSGWTWVAVFLVAALVFHVSDLALRWQRPGTATREGP